MDKKLYVAYGSNLNLPQMANRCPTAKLVGAKSEQTGVFKLLFRGGLRCLQLLLLNLLKIVKSRTLSGEITQPMKKALDRYEGYPFLYRKENIKVRVKTEEM